MLYFVLLNGRHEKSMKITKNQEIMEINENRENFDFLSLGRAKPFINITKIATFRSAENLLNHGNQWNHGNPWFPCFRSMQKPFIMLAIFGTFQCPELEITENLENQRKSREIIISILLEHAKTLYNHCYIWYFSMPGTGNHWESCKSMEIMGILIFCLSGVGNPL